jgi:hypothetical protein
LRKLYNENINDLYCYPNVIRVIKSRRMRWVGHVARMGKREVHKGFWWGNMSEKHHLGDPGEDGRIKLRWIFRNLDVGAWTVLFWFRIGTDGGHF